MKIDWKKLWEQFDAWSDVPTEICSKCNNVHTDYKEWDEQQRKIERLVEKQLKAQR